MEGLSESNWNKLKKITLEESNNMNNRLTNIAFYARISKKSKKLCIKAVASANQTKASRILTTYRLIWKLVTLSNTLVISDILIILNLI